MRRFHVSMIVFVSFALLASGPGCKSNKQKTQDKASAAQAKNVKITTPLVLKGVPADSFYAFGMLTPMPRNVLEKLYKKLQPAFKESVKVIDQLEARQKASTKPGVKGKPVPEEVFMKVVKAITEELAKDFSLKGMERLGIKPDWAFVLYGLGLLPAVRGEVSDAKAMKATIDRIIKNAGVEPVKEKFSNTEYLKIDLGPEMFAALAVTDKEIVIGIVPVKDKDKDRVLKLLFDPKAVGKSMYDDNKLADIVKQFSFQPYWAGYVDIQAIAEAVLGKSKGFSVDLLDAAGELKVPADAKSPECRSEILDLVSNFKRIVVGSDKIDDSEISASYVLETKPEVIKDLVDLASSGPGFGAVPKGRHLFSLGVNFDFSKALEIVRNRAKQAAQKPYKCKLLAELNQTAGSMDTTITMSVPPVVQGITGAQAVLESLTPGPGGMPKDVKGYLLVGSKNPLQLALILQGMLPQLSGMQINPTGQTAIPAQALPPFIKGAKLDIQKTYLAAYVGRKNPPPVPDGRKNNGKVLFHLSYKVDELNSVISALTPMPQEQKTPSFSLFDVTEMTLSVGDKGIVLKSTMHISDKLATK